MTDHDEIQRKLIEKYGAAVISAGLSAALNRGREYRFNHPEPCRPTPPDPPILPADYKPIQLGTPETAIRIAVGKTVKIWPQVLMAAHKAKHGGAARLWILAHLVDQQGVVTGRIKQADLTSYLKAQDISDRNRQRWTSDAINLGLLKPCGEYYYLEGLGRSAARLGASSVGRPVMIGLKHLCSSGWVPYVWAAYTATAAPTMSRRAIEEATGVPERTQRHLQAQSCIRVIQNFAPLPMDQDKAMDLALYKNLCVFVNSNNGRVIQRLPDTRSVPTFAAKKSPRGRSRKAQRLLNALLTLERGNQNKPLRMFYRDHTATSKALRRWGRDDDLPAWLRPSHVFEQDYQSQSSALWLAVPL